MHQQSTVKFSFIRLNDHSTQADKADTPLSSASASITASTGGGSTAFIMN